MRIIVGLGNPGAEYANTRHNAGLMLVDKIYDTRFKNHEYGFRKHKDIYIYQTDDLVLVKSAGIFMNESGRMIRGIRYRIPDINNNDLYLAHDDLDIKLGEYKIQFGTGPKDHNGVNSAEQALGTKDFWRIRIGVDNRQKPIDGETYVLQRFGEEERGIVKGVLDKIIHEITQADN